MKKYATLLERFQAPGPKRILSLDGGGIRGALTLGYLEKIEALVRNKSKDPEARLCDYFDLIGGTSTGAIIAACLAIGKTVAEIKREYLDLGGEIFGDRKGFLGISLHYKYDEAPLKKALFNMFGDIKVGDEGTNGLKTGLCVITKRMDTFSTWPVDNHPNGKYFARNQFLLRDIVRASTAAPTYFIPELIDLGRGDTGTFVDGGMSMMNNPALQLFMIATLKGYSFHWELGETQLQLISVGTGTRDVKLSARKYRNPNLIEFAGIAPEQFMHDASELVETMLQYFSDSPTARVIDKAMGNMEGEVLHNRAAMNYLRYNVRLERNELNAIGMSHIPDDVLADLTEMDDPDNRFILAEIGSTAASQQVLDVHFAPCFF
jgi:hypothetical protein